MVLVYHNITPPEYFVDVNQELVQLCFLGRRELALYAVALRSGARRFGIQPAGARGARLLADRRAAVVPGLRSPARARPTTRSAGDFDDDWVNLLFVGRVIPNKRIEDVIRWFHAYKTLVQSALAAAAGRLACAASSATWRCCTTSSRRLGARDVHSRRPRLERGAGRLLRARRRLRVRERARGLLRAAGRSRSTWACRCIAYAATAVPATMDGAGVLVHRQGSDARRRR